HDFFTELNLNEGIVNFYFPDILLPDSNANEPASHGHIIYRIRPKTGLTEGTRIENSADIYFDFNPPIQTNTTYSTFTQCGILDPLTDEVYFPGPTIWEADICAGEILEWLGQSLDSTGIYTELFQTADGCDSLVELHLTVHELPILDNVVIQEANSNGGGSIQPTITGGMPPYTYLWATGSTEAALENVTAGVYALLVTDAIGCSVGLEFEVPLNTKTVAPVSNQFQLMPNPVKRGSTIQLQFEEALQPDALILYDAFGRVQQIEIRQEAGVFIFQAPPEPGIYWLTAKGGGRQFSTRITVY
ncbi:MAG: T9SS type A sorting domain-containing protein, partial [Phaeodactylibacter sp.]|nr:T9SS type A sorting domain-containing protein [Phaeodactylibacter sp.]